ncbi:hypothetical protein [Humisphaera borealis]|uniref:Uncharacterized protein n=1 Tax=Humisphaera borealis TaxID=2807512 RepID=A0A7M2WZU3_9BACT|nr:hypothetical protein [Humisphaera borealis]QOV90894.1 hypothetical protein IPV69_05910 [Humisphaera borealis]
MATAKRATGPWKVRIRNAGFNRRHGPYCLSFVDGQASTDDARAAAWATECGYEVKDEATGQIVNPLPLTEAETAAQAEAAAAEAKKKAESAKK